MHQQKPYFQIRLYSVALGGHRFLGDTLQPVTHTMKYLTIEKLRRDLTKIKEYNKVAEGCKTGDLRSKNKN